MFRHMSTYPRNHAILGSVSLLDSLRAQVRGCKAYETVTDTVRCHVHGSGVGASEEPSTRDRQAAAAAARAVFGGGTFPNADALPGAGLLRRAGPGLAGPNIQLQAPPLRRNMVETSALIPSTRGHPLWVGYAWNVRALGSRPYPCSLCGTVGLQRQQVCVQRCNEVKHFFQKDSQRDGIYIWLGSNTFRSCIV